ncbi:hypothetical protein FOA52_009993 [Chlamydomonas sp. UWO 241]|nr:hypothetical protein FOA52_009993 [Chlamydomonas sp. UWO 241]
MLAHKQLVRSTGARASRASTLVVRADSAPRSEGPARWSTQYTYLRQNSMQSVSPDDASSKMANRDIVMIDVRPRKQYKRSHIQGSVNVPLYQELNVTTGNSFAKVLKFVAYAANGVTPIELNEEFVVELAAATAGKKGAVFACEAGGTLNESVNFPQGKASRSLQACHKAMTEAGMKTVMHLDRGLYGWYQADLPFEGEEEFKPDVGRTPNAAGEPMLQRVRQSTGYEMREDDKVDSK